MTLKVLRKDGFYGWINLCVMFVFNIVLFCLVMNAFGFCLPFWVNEFGWSRGLISGAQTLNLILAGIAAPMVGIFLMKHGARKAIVIGNIMSTVALLMMAFQTHIWELYLWSGVLMGLGMSIGGMLAMMTVTNNWFIMKRSIALAITMGSMGLNLIIGPALMSLINMVGWRRSFMIIAAISFVLCVLLPGVLIKNKPEDLGQVPDGPVLLKVKLNPGGNPYKALYKTPVDFTAREALRTKTLWLLVAYGTLQFFCINGLMPHQVAFLLDIGISANVAAMATGLLSAVMSISSLGIGLLGLRIQMRSLAVASSAIGIVGFTTLIFSHSLPMVIAYCVILGIGFGIQGIAMGNLFPDYFGRSEFPKIMGYTMPINTIASSLGAPIAGFIRDATGSYIHSFQVFLALCFLAFLCILFAKPPLHPSLKGKVKVEEPEPQLVS